MRGIVISIVKIFVAELDLVIYSYTVRSWNFKFWVLGVQAMALKDHMSCMIYVFRQSCRNLFPVCQTIGLADVDNVSDLSTVPEMDGRPVAKCD